MAEEKRKEEERLAEEKRRELARLEEERRREEARLEEESGAKFSDPWFMSCAGCVLHLMHHTFRCIMVGRMLM